MLTASAPRLTELFHLVGDNRREMESAWKFVRSGAIELAPAISRPSPQAALIHARIPRRSDSISMI